MTERQSTHYVGDDCPGGHRDDRYVRTVSFLTKQARDGWNWARNGWAILAIVYLGWAISNRLDADWTWLLIDVVMIVVSAAVAWLSHRTVRELDRLASDVERGF